MTDARGPGRGADAALPLGVSSARWRRLEPLLDVALDLPPERRDAFLRDACGDDDALRA